MHGACFDYPLQKWFDFKVPKTTVAPDYILNALQQEEYVAYKPTTKIIWLGNQPSIAHFTKSKKGNHWQMSELNFQNKRIAGSIKVSQPQGEWLVNMLEKCSVHNMETCTLQEIKESYEAADLEDFELFWDNKPVNTLYQFGLLQL